MAIIKEIKGSELFLWMNGRLIYKKWLNTGQSKVFDVIAYDKYTLASISDSVISTIKTLDLAPQFHSLVSTSSKTSTIRQGYITFQGEVLALSFENKPNLIVKIQEVFHGKYRLRRGSWCFVLGSSLRKDGEKRGKKKLSYD